MNHVYFSWVFIIFSYTQRNKTASELTILSILKFNEHNHNYLYHEMHTNTMLILEGARAVPFACTCYSLVPSLGTRLRACVRACVSVHIPPPHSGRKCLHARLKQGGRDRVGCRPSSVIASSACPLRWLRTFRGWLNTCKSPLHS